MVISDKNFRYYKTDRNQDAIVRALRSSGYLVVCTTMVGNGYPDLTVCTPDKRIVLLEVKNGDAKPVVKLSPRQDAFIDAGWPVHIVFTPEDALRCCQIDTAPVMTTHASPRLKPYPPRRTQKHPEVHAAYLARHPWMKSS